MLGTTIIQVPCLLHAILGFCTHSRAVLSDSTQALLNSVTIKLASQSNRSVIDKWKVFVNAFEVKHCDLATVRGIRFGKWEQNCISLVANRNEIKSFCDHGANGKADDLSKLMTTENLRELAVIGINWKFFIQPLVSELLNKNLTFHDVIGYTHQMAEFKIRLNNSSCRKFQAITSSASNKWAANVKESWTTTQLLDFAGSQNIAQVDDMLIKTTNAVFDYHEKRFSSEFMEIVKSQPDLTAYCHMNQGVLESTFAYYKFQQQQSSSWTSEQLCRIARSRQNKTLEYIESLSDYEVILQKCFKDIPIYEQLEHDDRALIRGAQSAKMRALVAKSKSSEVIENIEINTAGRYKPTGHSLVSIKRAWFEWNNEMCSTHPLRRYFNSLLKYLQRNCDKVVDKKIFKIPGRHEEYSDKLCEIANVINVYSE